MKAKIEAKELVDKFLKQTSGWTKATAYERAKQCALICVDKIYHIKMKYGRFEGYKDYWNYYSFWEDVKQEINKL